MAKRQRSEAENKDIKKIRSQMRKSIDNILEDYAVQYSPNAEKKARLDAAGKRMKDAQIAAKKIQEANPGMTRAEALKIHYGKK